MKKMMALQITCLILVSGALGGMLVYTNVYERVQLGIVEVLCLSCLKLDPKTLVEFTFETANGKPNPEFVLDNLSKGPVFLAFRSDVCDACDIMEPIIQDIFSVHFEKEETVVKTIIINDVNVTLIHINLDHSPKELIDSIFIYDADHVGGVPQFVIISYGYERGFVKPVYGTAYGTLNLGSNGERKEFLEELIQNGIDEYIENHAGHLE